MNYHEKWFEVVLSDPVVIWGNTTNWKYWDMEMRLEHTHNKITKARIHVKQQEKK